MITRDEMVDALRAGIATVTFNKVNGDERVMECTLKEDFIPNDQLPKTDDEGVQRTIDVIRAYDVRAAGWRSFRVENVTNFV
jgi:hypothetical protein